MQTLVLASILVIVGAALGPGADVTHAQELPRPASASRAAPSRQAAASEAYPIDEHGVAHVPPKPGVGVELDWDAVDRTCVEHKIVKAP